MGEYSPFYTFSRLHSLHEETVSMVLCRVIVKKEDTFKYMNIMNKWQVVSV